MSGEIVNSIYDLTMEELENYFLEHQDKKFHAVQLFEWLYQKRIKMIEEATNLKKETREQLKKDFSFQNITITSVETSKDLYYSKVFFTSIKDLPINELEKEMNEASDFVRKKVAEKIDLRQTPKIKFIYDKSIEYGNKIEKIIAEINKKKKL